MIAIEGTTIPVVTVRSALYLSWKYSQQYRDKLFEKPALDFFCIGWHQARTQSSHSLCQKLNPEIQPYALPKYKTIRTQIVSRMKGLKTLRSVEPFSNERMDEELKLCLICGNIATQKACFDVGDSARVVERYCDTCVKSVKFE